MCWTSAVFDQYQPWIPQPQKTFPWPAPGTPKKAVEYPSAEEVRELIDSFHKAIEAAKTFDRLTGQPDCEDPDKAALVKRVEDLERRLEEMGA